MEDKSAAHSLQSLVEPGEDGVDGALPQCIGVANLFFHSSMVSQRFCSHNREHILAVIGTPLFWSVLSC